MACIAVRATRRRQKALQFMVARRDFAAAHALLRAALSAVAERPRDEWTFETARYGKPRLAPALLGDETRFFDIWTLKEAYIRRGLSHPLDTFRFTFDRGGSLGFESADPRGAPAWRFAPFDIAGSYRLSVAVHARSGRPTRIVLHEATSVDARVAAVSSTRSCGTGATLEALPALPAKVVGG